MKNLILAAMISTSALLPLYGCSTAPTEKQEVAINSGIRISTIAYITRGKTPAEQSKRAEQLQSVSVSVRQYVESNGTAAINLDALAAYANAYVLSRKDLSDGDKVLAQAVVLEAIYLVSDSGAVVVPALDADNMVRLLNYLLQIERVTKAFIAK